MRRSAALLRSPSIAFRYGKREAAAKAAPPSPSAASPPTSFLRSLEQLYPSKATRSYLDLPPMFGRPRVGAKEAATVESGGAA